MSSQAHVTLSGDIAGEYVVIERRPDGELMLAPDTSIAAIRKRLGTRAMTPEESAAFWHEQGPHMLPSDDEG
ncbi:MAG TPA: hypothetical protein VID29_10290 [Solirubrobacteraceae bacterium]